MRRSSAALAATILGILATAASAAAIVLHAGDLVIHADGGFTPTALPKKHDAPIKLYGGGRLSTLSGDFPPVLKTLTIEFDRHGSVQTKGLETCAARKLQATDVPAARRACPGAIVGKGGGSAVVVFPEQRPIRISSPITLFNGPPKKGEPTVIAHAYTDVPVATTYIVPIVIETIDNGVYGYRTKAKIPPIAGGAGIPISGHLKVGREWTYKGQRYSYVNARCETGRLQAKGEFSFDDGTFLTGNFIRRCTVRKG